MNSVYAFRNNSVRQIHAGIHTRWSRHAVQLILYKNGQLYTSFYSGQSMRDTIVILTNNLQSSVELWYATLQRLSPLSFCVIADLLPCWQILKDGIDTGMVWCYIHSQITSLSQVTKLSVRICCCVGVTVNTWDFCDKRGEMISCIIIAILWVWLVWLSCFYWCVDNDVMLL